jgi:hypothetical protein
MTFKKKKREKQKPKRLWPNKNQPGGFPPSCLGNLAKNLIVQQP